MRTLAFWLGYRYYMKLWNKWAIFRTSDGHEFCSEQEFFDDLGHHPSSWRGVREAGIVFMFRYRGN